MGYTRRLKPHEVDIWKDRRPLIGQLDIELTERCNNNCIHCNINLPEQDMDARSREMDTPFVKDILKQAADLGCLTVRFTGGEPLLRDDFEELYVFARRLGMKVILFTNARRMTPHLGRLLAQVPPGRPVEVTVYGMHPHSYDAAAAVRGAFAEFWKGMTVLRDHKIPFIVKQPLLPPNRDEIDEFELFASTVPWMESKPAYSMNFDMRGRRDSAEKNRVVARLRFSPEETVAMFKRDPSYIRSLREFCGKFMGPAGDSLFSCGAGHGTCVDAYGQAQLCLLMRDPATVVPLKTTSLRTVLKEVFPRLRELKTTNAEYLSRCARCFLKGLCEQCPAKSWAEHGTLDTPVEYLCRIAHALARHIGLLAEGQKAWEIKDWRCGLESMATTER